MKNKTNPKSIKIPKDHYSSFFLFTSLINSTQISLSLAPLNEPTCSPSLTTHPDIVTHLYLPLTAASTQQPPSTTPLSFSLLHFFSSDLAFDSDSALHRQQHQHQGPPHLAIVRAPTTARATSPRATTRITSPALLFHRRRGHCQIPPSPPSSSAKPPPYQRRHRQHELSLQTNYKALRLDSTSGSNKTRHEPINFELCLEQN